MGPDLTMSEDEMEYVVITLRDAAQKLEIEEQKAIQREADLLAQVGQATRQREYIQNKLRAVRKYIRGKEEDV